MNAIAVTGCTRKNSCNNSISYYNYPMIAIGALTILMAFAFPIVLNQTLGFRVMPHRLNNRRMQL